MNILRYRKVQKLTTYLVPVTCTGFAEDLPGAAKEIGSLGSSRELDVAKLGDDLHGTEPCIRIVDVEQMKRDVPASTNSESAVLREPLKEIANFVQEPACFPFTSQLRNALQIVRHSVGQTRRGRRLRFTLPLALGGRGWRQRDRSRVVFGLIDAPPLSKLGVRLTEFEVIFLVLRNHPAAAPNKGGIHTHRSSLRRGKRDEKRSRLAGVGPDVVIRKRRPDRWRGNIF